MSNVDRVEDLRQAIQFVLQNLQYWRLEEPVQDFYSGWLRRLDAMPEPSDDLPLPQAGETAQSPRQQWRFRSFLDKQLTQHVEAGRFMEDDIAALREENRKIGRELKEEFEDDSLPVDDAEVVKDKASRQISIGRLLDAILDPRSLQYLMMMGAGLLIVGLVIWLATQGYFDNPLTIAIAAAIANLGVLGGGAYLLRKTRFEMAGRGLCLLACMAMPLHLWFYDAQGLIVLDEGGHLWIPALVIMLLYGVCAYLIRDRLFAFAVVGGVTLTGLMLLGDQTIGKFWEGAATSTLLLVIGAIAIHIRQAFPDREGPFSRNQFGEAFFHAGHCVLLAGLAVLLTWNVTAWTYGGPLNDLWHNVVGRAVPFEQPSLATSWGLKMLAFGLTLAATYLYAYSYVTDRQRGIWLAGGMVVFLWAEIVFVDLLPISFSQELVILMSGVVGLSVVLVDRLINRQTATDENPSQAVAICGNVYLSVAGIAAVLMSLNRLMQSGFHGNALLVLIVLMGASLLASVVSGNREIRRFYSVLAISQAIAGILLLVVGIDMYNWQKAELLTMAAGAILLAVAHVGWTKEDHEHQDDFVSVGLLFGSLLFAAPVVIGMVGERLGMFEVTTTWRLVHEIGSLAVGLTLLGSGILLRLRATTITGAATMLLYLGTLVVYFRLPEQLQNVAVYMMIGGGAFFLIAMLLSIFRDYLLGIPKRFENRAGLFRVLTWR